MPRRCTVCDHPERGAIDKALVAGKSAAEISALFRVSPDAVQRHKDNHLPARLVKAEEAREVAQADDLLAEARALRKKAYAILLKAEQSGDLRTALLGVREARGCLELLARLLHEIDDRPTVSVLVLPEWVALRGRIVAALAPYPEARVALAGVLGDGD